MTNEFNNNREPILPEPTLGEQPIHPSPDGPLPTDPFHLQNLNGFIQTIEFVPAYTPKSFLDQFVLVTSGGSSRAYLYDTKFTGGGAWRYTVLT